MRAWNLHQLGQPATLDHLDRPSPAPGEALVRVSAAGLNFADLLMAEGRYQDRPALPFIPGLELAGRVEALGHGTEGPAPGSRVAAHVTGGAYAEYAVVPVSRLLALPDDMPMTTAAGFQVGYGTAHLALTHAARLRPGETLFVTGAAGGAGLTAVEVGRDLGARVIAQVRGPEKAALARAAGAEMVIDSGEPDLKAALRAAGGVDVVYDTVGGPGFDAALRATRPGGRLLAIGFAGGEVPKVALNHLLVRNVSVIGFWWGGYLGFAPEALTASLAALIGRWQVGALRPHISQILPFEALPEGLALIRNRKATGKIVLRVDDQAE